MIYKNYSSAAIITGAITTIFSSFTTMVLSIFKLPKIIADYLFNKEEDKLMSEIIQNIQKYEIDAVKYELESIKLKLEKIKLEKIKEMNSEASNASNDANNSDGDLTIFTYNTPSQNTSYEEQDENDII